MSSETRTTHRERVGRVAQALDSIRYEDEGIVRYSLSEIAEKANEIEDEFSEVFDALEEDFDEWEENRKQYEQNKQQLKRIRNDYDEKEVEDSDLEELLDDIDQYIENEDSRMDQQGELVEDIEDRFLTSIGLLERSKEIREKYSHKKYSSDKKENGPGAFITIVDGPKEAMEAYASEMPNTNWKNELDENMPSDYEPDIFDEGFPQAVYETMESNDGAIVMGDNGFSSSMYEIPDVEDMDEDLMPKKGGTKHRAAVKAVHADLKDMHGEELEVTSIVLSETDGYIRVFGEDGGTEFPYNKQNMERVGDFWENDSINSVINAEEGEPIEY